MAKSMRGTELVSTAPGKAPGWAASSSRAMALPLDNPTSQGSLMPRTSSSSQASPASSGTGYGPSGGASDRPWPRLSKVSTRCRAVRPGRAPAHMVVSDSSPLSRTIQGAPGWPWMR